MARQLINDGILPNDGQGDTLRQGASKINNNFQELYQTLGNGTQITLIENNLLNATGSNKVTFLYQTFDHPLVLKIIVFHLGKLEIVLNFF